MKSYKQANNTEMLLYLDGKFSSGCGSWGRLIAMIRWLLRESGRRIIHTLVNRISGS